MRATYHVELVHAYMVAVPTSALKVIQGKPRVYTIAPGATTSGAPCHRYFCGDCGTPLYALSEALPEKTTVKLAIFDNTIKPSIEAFWKNAKGPVLTFAAHKLCMLTKEIIHLLRVGETDGSCRTCVSYGPFVRLWGKLVSRSYTLDTILRRVRGSEGGSCGIQVTGSSESTSQQQCQCWSTMDSCN